MTNKTPLVIYEGRIDALKLEAFGIELDVSDILSSGRSNYILFQKLVARCANLQPNSEGGKSDLVSPTDQTFEVKAFKDVDLHPSASCDLFHTAASSTFPANNLGPTIKALLKAGDYNAALQMCKDTGYSKNDFYVYTNTSEYSVSTPFRYIVVPTALVLANLSTTDPRLINRRDLLALCTKTVSLGSLSTTLAA